MKRPSFLRRRRALVHLPMTQGSASGEPQAVFQGGEGSVAHPLHREVFADHCPTQGPPLPEEQELALTRPTKGSFQYFRNNSKEPKGRNAGESPGGLGLAPLQDPHPATTSTPASLPAPGLEPLPEQTAQTSSAPASVLQARMPTASPPSGPGSPRPAVPSPQGGTHRAGVTQV